MLPKIRGGWSPLLLGAALQAGCPQHPPAPAAAAAAAADASAAATQLDPAQDYALVLSQHETIGDAAIERALYSGLGLRLEGGPAALLNRRSTTENGAESGSVTDSVFTWWLAGGLTWRL